ncbi:hypothetical protein AAFF_G00111970 [Aldrovandia affinis]|uniref:Surfeit locus protein 2 n=1 Tax=Aldrovandia affinis TaxID=143900 RepID=A0AAD7RW02_9TELE|nr:hypothetical protein AAFF_G00111970 [Aldrovandia affinis]
MAEIPADVQAFIKDHPFLQLSDANRVKCTLNGHEFPCDLKELQNFTSGKKYQKLSSVAEFSYSQYEPHVVPSTKQPNHLFCKLTLRHINRLPHQVLRHVNGQRYQRALQKYEECVRQGVVFVPARLQQKKRREPEGERGRNSRRGNGFWEPNSSEGEGNESDDSMSDLYPSTTFTLKKQQAGEGEMVEGAGSDDFQTDGEEEEASPMEVDKQTTHKRRKVQSAGFKKKFKSHNKKKKGLKKVRVRYREILYLENIGSKPCIDLTSRPPPVAMASSSPRFTWCSCRKHKIPSKDPHERCLHCLGIQHAKEAVLEYGRCPHCAKMDWSTCINRLTKVQEVIYRENQLRKSEAAQLDRQPKPESALVPVSQSKAAKDPAPFLPTPVPLTTTPAPPSTIPVMFTILSPPTGQLEANHSVLRGAHMPPLAVPPPGLPPSALGQAAPEAEPPPPPPTLPSSSSSLSSSSSSSSPHWSGSDDSSCSRRQQKKRKRRRKSSRQGGRQERQQHGRLLEAVQQKLEAQQQAAQAQWSLLEQRIEALERRGVGSVGAGPVGAVTVSAVPVSPMALGPGSSQGGEREAGRREESGDTAALRQPALSTVVKQEEEPCSVSAGAEGEEPSEGEAEEAPLLPDDPVSRQDVLTAAELQALIARAANSQPFREVCSKMYRLHDCQAPAYDRMPQVNRFMSAIFQAVKPSENKEASVPAERWRFTETLAERVYQTAGMLARTANYLRYLSDYQKRLLVEITEDRPAQRFVTVLNELKLIGEFAFQLSSHQAELSGRVMASSVAIRRQIWMAKTNYTDALKATVADLPFVVSHTFGAGTAPSDTVCKQESS